MGKTNDENTGHYEGALLEEIRDNVKQLAESTSGLAGKVDSIDRRLSRVEQDTKLIPSIKAAVTEQTKHINDHERRIISLEEARA